ncbi:hypothetical protein [Rhodovulum kholense]|uniref:Uncharacterized protein n=1 Tax=Rhodovulum kholense TaxID=453584 RepID=A0A8E2VJG3_9RHOB|nr:hypothetical protein [Rhodovulum kholense]PTW45708.1 hypothetical protein C8N38_113109 [Rhodovulum kholense]
MSIANRLGQTMALKEVTNQLLACEPFDAYQFLESRETKASQETGP